MQNEADNLYMSPEQVQADDAKYSALASELSEADAELGGEGPGEPIEQERPAPRQAQDSREPTDEELNAQADEILRQRIAEFQNEHTAEERLNADPVQYFKDELDRRKAQETESAFWGNVIKSEQDIRQTVPDYDDACQHLENGRRDELAVMFPDKDANAVAVARVQGFRSPAELRDAILNQDRLAVARAAMQRGISPAQMYYDLAQRRGYQSKRSTTARRSSGKSNDPGKLAAKASAAFDAGDDEAFEKAWAEYAKAASAA